MDTVQATSSPQPQLAEVLRSAGVALQGRIVGLWEATDSGQVMPVATSPGRPMPPTALREVNEALDEWRVDRAKGRRWLACRLDLGRWCIAPVRGHAPGPPRDGVERRRRERMTLELAALALGLIDGLEGEIARHRVMEDTLRRNQQDLDDFFDNAPLALHWLAPDGTILRANRAEHELLGYGADEFVGRNITEIHADREVIEDLLRRVSAGETMRNVEARLRRRDGSIRYALLSANARFDEAGRLLHTRCATRDITELKAAETQLRHSALHDPLTSLPNRTLFLERVARGLQRCEREADYGFGVMFLDCDHFKMVNDSMGHLAGDRLLVDLAHRLEAMTRPGDLVARLGGDEFTLFVEGVTDVLDAARVAERVRQQMARPFIVEGQELYLSASIGLALSASGYARPEDALRDADIAMYRAKAQGRARYEIFDPTMRERARRRLSLEMGLRRAVERQEFRLLYQPVVDLGSGGLKGFEALLRWAHPERGLVPPAEFLSVAEETGLIVGIGEWVLHEACRQARAWQVAHPRPDPLTISVNLSAQQVTRGSLMDHVTSALRESGLAPPQLWLEVTENLLLEGIEEVAGRIERLRTLDVELHMDDFGTGYSSLDYLRRFPLDALKIDRSFVRRLGSRRGDTELVRTIIALAQNLEMDVIAEGVETDAQRERLVDLGCRLGQGYLFAMPLDPAVAEVWLNSEERPGR